MKDLFMGKALVIPKQTREGLKRKQAVKEIHRVDDKKVAGDTAEAMPITDDEIGRFRDA